MGSEENLTSEECGALISLGGSSDVWRSLCRKGLASFCPPTWLTCGAYFLTGRGEEVRADLLAQPLGLTNHERFNGGFADAWVA